MRIAAIAAAVLIAAASGGWALAQGMDVSRLVEDGTGLPMKPSDAAGGVWLVEAGGRTVCQLELSGRQSAPGIYRARIPSACADLLPPGLVGWRPVSDGLGLVDADDHVVLDFNQWTPRKLAARRPGASALQLVRPQA